LADSNTKRSPHLREILEKARPRLEPEVEEASLKEARLAIPTPMLDVIFRDGRVRSFNYAYLSEVEFEPGDKLTIKYTTGVEITLEGRGLSRHRQQVRLHRADEIRECSETEQALLEDGVSQVETIHITEGEKQ
jgi:hypothetical protein